VESSRPDFRAALAYWVRLGWVNFGGPAGQIALLHRDLVERRRWVDEPRFLHALNFCMLLPGPEAKQLAIYLGWLLHGTAGALAAGLGFVLPSVLLLWALAWLYSAHGEVPAVAAALAGIQPVVVAIVLEAVVRIGRRAFRHPLHAVFAAVAFLALLRLSAPFPAIVGAAAIAGAICVRFVAPFAPTGPNVDGESPAAVAASGRHWPWRPLAAGAALWTAGLALVALARPAVPVLADLYGFFTRAAFVTFGGAYAVLAYVAQVAVGRFGWLSPAAMLDGLALAETTPGPLIIVLEFVGFQAGWNHPGTWTPLAAATAGALATAWVTFLPSFVFILVGAPYVERLRGRRWLAGALAGVTAAVVGVILHLGWTFGRQVLLGGGRPDPVATAIAAAALLALVRYDVKVPWLVAAGALAGLARLAASG
jgi:chromate transporter